MVVDMGWSGQRWPKSQCSTGPHSQTSCPWGISEAAMGERRRQRWTAHCYSTLLPQGGLEDALPEQGS